VAALNEGMVYLDHAATTPVRAEVLEAMLPYLGERFGNPSSAHGVGRAARHALEEARERLAAVLGAGRKEVYFTSGGTEADNLAVLGRWRAVRRERPDAVVACSAVEHRAVLAAVQAAGSEGARTVVLGVDGEGRVGLETVEEVLQLRPALVSVMWANNEVGTLQPVAEIGSRCRAGGVVFHTDAVQAFGRVRVRVDETACDLLSLSAHKLGGPKGMGALYVRDGVQLDPLLHGGGQERELRPGTENVAGAVGLAVAAELAAAEQAAEAARLGALRDRLQAGLSGRIAGLEIHGGGGARVPHILNVGVPAVDQDAVLVGLDLEGVAVSSGSACHSGAVEPSHVLVAMGRDAPDTASVRFSLGRTTTAEEVERVIEVVARVVERSRAMAGS